MSRVSKKVAERVSRYPMGGLTIPSAEGEGISRSKEGLEEGIKLAEASLLRLRKQRGAAKR